MNGGSMDTAPTASGEAKEKAGHRTRSASRLSLVNGGEIDTAQTASGEAKEEAGHRTRSASRLSLARQENGRDIVFGMSRRTKAERITRPLFTPWWACKGV